MHTLKKGANYLGLWDGSLSPQAQISFVTFHLPGRQQDGSMNPALATVEPEIQVYPRATLLRIDVVDEAVQPYDVDVLVPNTDYIARVWGQYGNLLVTSVCKYIGDAS